MDKKIKHSPITDEAYDGSGFKALNLDEMVLMPKLNDSTAERLKLAKALQNLGVTSLDKRIYKQKKK